jgi:hypothetical protein
LFSSRFFRASELWRRGTSAALSPFTAASVVLAFAAPANAHGFGQRYDLPLPLQFYLYGAAAVVVATFLLAGLFIRRAPEPRRGSRLDLLSLPGIRLLAHPLLILAIKFLSVGLFVLAVAAGFFGNQNPYRNLAPTLVWIIVWVGVAYVSAFVGDVWSLINPWRTIYGWAEGLFARLGNRTELSFRLSYPKALGVWPAVGLLLAFSWIELVYPTPAVPAQIACFAVGYSLLTWSGMAAFGRETWLRHGEVFSVVFGTFARFAPTEPRGRTPPALFLRPFGAGLLDERSGSPSMTAFVLLLLSTVLYDGLLSTPEFARLENAIGARLVNPGEFELIAVRTIGLIVFWLLFLGAFLAVSALMSAAASSRLRPNEIARRFALTLVPIAIGYHVAHYLVFLLIQGQYIIPLLSDPFGCGWNLFGTAGYRVDIAAVGARFAWYAAVAAVLVGHVVAVYLAHVVATRTPQLRNLLLRSQAPLTALMVVYTFVSLSILAEPIVERREPAQPSAVAVTEVAVPADAVLPQDGTGLLRPVGPDKVAKVRLTYRVLGSAFHDSTKTSIADLLYAYSFAFRWGTKGDRSRHYDPDVDDATASLRRQLVALRAIGSDAVSRSFRIGDVNFVRELFTVEIYATTAPENPETHATVPPPWSTIPWHLTVLMEEAVSRGWAAFSQREAARLGVAWLELIRSGQLNGRLASLIESFEREGYRPEALQSLVSAEEARRRWAALAAFYKEHGHFLVTNGPYRVKRWSADSVTLEAFRDLTYPLGVGSYDAYAVPRRGFITKVERNENRLSLSGEIETVVKFARDYRIERAPIASISRDVVRRSAPQCRYIVTDDKGQVAFEGVVALDEASTFQIDLDGKLDVGDYTVMATIIVNENAMNAEIRRIPMRIEGR